MLIDFSVTNFRSIKERQTFSMQTVGKVKELPKNVIQNEKNNLVKSVIIYGRNASGKSNLLLAMDALKNISNGTNYNVALSYKPYKLSSPFEEKPVEFEINFIAKNKLHYNYYISFNSKEIIRENLYYYPKNRRSKLFERTKDDISLGDSFKGDIFEIQKNLYSYHSLLSRVNFYKIDSLIEPFLFFNKHFVTQSFIGVEENLLHHFISMATGTKLPEHISNINKLLKVADTGIDSVKVKENKIEDFHFPETFNEETKKAIYEKNRYHVSTVHDVYKEGKIVDKYYFQLNDESAGTIKLLALGSVILDCLSDGDVLFIDELDKGLHPILTCALINIFNNSRTNPNNAQLIFASHDVSLLSCEFFRRDQIWLVDKDVEGYSKYYSLADLNGVRKDIPFEKYYLRGSFGATPVINEYDFDFNLDKRYEK